MRLEREEAGAFVSVKASSSRELVNGPEIIRRYEATPTVAAEPLATTRRHLWTASWETLPDTPLGRYRFVVTGRAKQGGTIEAYRLESAPFEVTASSAIVTLRPRVVESQVLLELRYEPNPLRFDRGDPARHLRLRDVESRPEDGALARGGQVDVAVRSPAGTSSTLTATWDEARRGHVLNLPASPAGTWELSVAANAYTDRLGNQNGSALRSTVVR